MPRGGRRPGAGAPQGNINALKQGRYSTREIWTMVEEAMLDPKKKRRLIKFLITSGEEKEGEKEDIDI